MPRQREVVIHLPADACARAEQIERKPIEEVLLNLWSEYVNDGRRKVVPLIRTSIRWPPDWYDRMQKKWGARMLPTRVRELVLRSVDTDPSRPLSQFVEPHNQRPKRKPKPSERSDSDEPSLHGAIRLPEDWVERIRNVWGANKLGTYIKAVVYNELLTWTWPRGEQPSVPKGLRTMLDEI